MRVAQNSLSSDTGGNKLNFANIIYPKSSMKLMGEENKVRFDRFLGPA